MMVASQNGFPSRAATIRDPVWFFKSLGAFGAGQTPVLDGKITYVSTDSKKAALVAAVITWQKLPVSWKDKQTMIPGAVVPGMPVTIAVKTGEKTLLRYVLDPLAGFYWRTLR